MPVAPVPSAVCARVAACTRFANSVRLLAFVMHKPNESKCSELWWAHPTAERLCADLEKFYSLRSVMRRVSRTRAAPTLLWSCLFFLLRRMVSFQACFVFFSLYMLLCSCICLCACGSGVVRECSGDV